MLLTPSTINETFHDVKLWYDLQRIEVRNTVGDVYAYTIGIPDGHRRHALRREIYGPSENFFPNAYVYVGVVRYENTGTGITTFAVDDDAPPIVAGSHRERCVKIFAWALWYIQHRQEPPEGYVIRLYWGD